MRRKMIRLMSLFVCIALAVGCSDGVLLQDSLNKDGDKNENVDEGENGGEEQPNPEVTAPQAALALPNSYMLLPGESLDLPIVKAFAVWTEKSDAFGKVNLTGKLKARLVWADPEGLIEETALKVVGTDINSAYIQVQTQAGVEGNAVVAIEVGGVVRWSWHLWVSKYDPADTNAATLGATSVSGGVVYRYNNGTGDYVLMDRNLGALSTNPKNGTNKKTWGMFYQWGRKDPFAGTSFKNVIPENPPVNNLAEATENPDVFLVASGNGDWYSYRNKQDHDLWGAESRKKSIYDPCPDGWMVPLFNRKLGPGDFGYINQNEYGFNGSPWNGLQHYVEGPNAFSWISGEYPGITSPAVGYYPAAGYLTLNGGEHWWGPDEIRKWGYYWVAEAWTTTNPHDAGMMLFLNSSKFELYAHNSWKRAEGLQLRCVRENKE